MGATIKVRDMVQQMDVLGPGFTVYLNRGTGEFVTLSEEEVEALDTEDPEGVPEWMQEYLPKLREARESADCLALPDSFDIHEWEIMRSFAVSVSSADASDDLLRALHGKGAFRYFRDQLHRLGLAEQWYRFRAQALDRIAVEWLEANGIPYTYGSDEFRLPERESREIG